jgi:protein O-GlcNAc transferase
MQTAIGHWLEHLMPLVSALREEEQQQQSTMSFPADRILVLHLKRTHLIEWVRAVLAAAINTNIKNNKDIGQSDKLPPIYLQKEVSSMWDQIGTPLEGVDDTEWICFQKVLVVKDTFNGGGRVVKTPQDAENFRNKAYEMHEMPSPPPVQARKEGKWSLNITVFHKSMNRRIVNEAALLRMLRQFSGRGIRVVEFNFDTPFKEQLGIMASTHIVVSTHTSALANVMFLPPGAVVLELIHRNWVWSNLDSSFKAQSDARGDLYHWAWRAVKKEHGKYINPRDEERFGGDEWAGEKVRTTEERKKKCFLFAFLVHFRHFFSKLKMKSFLSCRSVTQMIV